MNNFFNALKLSVLMFVSLGVSASNLFNIENMQFEGAFRIPLGTYGESRMGFATGTMAVDPKNNSFFVMGHRQHKAIAEFKIPTQLSKSENLSDLPMADRPIQDFTTILDRVPSGNPERLGSITGIEVFKDSLIINAAEYYDGDADNTNTTFIVSDKNNLKASEIRGFFNLDAANHAAGWMSPIPKPLQQELSADYIFGHASNLPINSRNSMGPSAFGVQIDDVMTAGQLDVIRTQAFLDFSITHQLHQDHYNETLENDVWTEVSRARQGFIIPGTRTYAVFGNSAGHEFGIGYKIVQDDGHLCGGPCPFVVDDQYNYFWFWNVDDLVDVKNGLKKPHEIKPTAYGELNLKFERDTTGGAPHLIIGVDYDYENNRLYILLGSADDLQSKYESAPLMLVYSLGINAPLSPTNVLVD